MARGGMADNGVMFRVICVALLLPVIAAPGQAEFSGRSSDYVPEGKQYKQAGSTTVEQCEADCAASPRCKAYAFRTSRPMCYFYSEVFKGGTSGGRDSGLYSTGLSIMPKKGFASAFKSSSFPTFTRLPRRVPE